MFWSSRRLRVVSTLEAAIEESRHSSRDTIKKSYADKKENGLQEKTMKSLAAGIFFLLVTSAAQAETNTVTSTLTGTNTIDRTVGSAQAPNIIINNQDTCAVGASVGVQGTFIGLAAAKTFEDPTCRLIKLSRQLYQMNMKVAAISVLCTDPTVFKSMLHAATPCPYAGLIGDAAKAKWEENPHERPDWKELRKTKHYENGRWQRINGEVKYVYD